MSPAKPQDFRPELVDFWDFADDLDDEPVDTDPMLSAADPDDSEDVDADDLGVASTAEEISMLSQGPCPPSLRAWQTGDGAEEASRSRLPVPQPKCAEAMW